MVAVFQPCAHAHNEEAHAHNEVKQPSVCLFVSQLIVSWSTKMLKNKNYQKFLVSVLAVHYSCDSMVQCWY